jgi:hypothetical protein
MRKIFLIIAALPVAVISHAQLAHLFTIKKDSSGFELTAAGASHLASLPLKCIEQEWPNKTNHTSNNDTDHVLSPKELHPAFYGCFDWHSCVHGHWMLVKLLKLFPNLPEAGAIRSTLNRTITDATIKEETNYFNRPLTASWERTYGWGWLLKLDEELLSWDNEDGRRWHTTLQPLVQKIVSLWKNFLPKQTYPNRTGVHPNTAFGLVFAIDYARAVKDTAFEKAITRSSMRIYGNDKNAPATWEPNGSDFLSPALEEADLMRRILQPAAFVRWFDAFLPAKSLQHLSILPVVSDRSDLQIVHLDGLTFSRSWCMKGLVDALPKNDTRRKTLLRSSLHHLSTALPNVVSGHYGGEHWLASFAVYALTN